MPFLACSVSSTRAICATNKVAAWHGWTAEQSTKPLMTSLSLHTTFTVTFSPGLALFTLHWYCYSVSLYSIVVVVVFCSVHSIYDV